MFSKSVAKSFPQTKSYSINARPVGGGNEPEQWRLWWAWEWSWSGVTSRRPLTLKTNAENEPKVTENGPLCVYTTDAVAFSSLEPVSFFHFRPKTLPLKRCRAGQTCWINLLSTAVVSVLVGQQRKAQVLFMQMALICITHIDVICNSPDFAWTQQERQADRRGVKSIMHAVSLKMWNFSFRG